MKKLWDAMLWVRVLICLPVLCMGCKEAPPAIPAPPNVVIIFTDDQGYADTGRFGANDIETPNLDKLADQGLVLTSFYAAQAVCSASRAGLLTGCYPNRIGIHNAFMPGSPIGLNPSETTLAELLKAKGYATAIFGKWHLGDQAPFLPLNHGFDEYFGIPYSNDMWPYHPQQGPVFDFKPLPVYENNRIIDTLDTQEHLTREITERSVDFIRRNAASPFFLYVPHPQPHVPLFVSDRFRGKSGRGLYGDVIMELDWSVGQIMDALKSEGIEENTLVIFTSDNGPWLSYGNHAGSAFPLREGKGTAWEGGQREPFIARYPGVIPAGLVSDRPVMAIDLLPTIAEFTGASLPELPIDGKSAVSLFTGESDASPQDSYAFYYRVNELHAVRYGPWKLYLPHTYRSMAGQQAGKDGIPGNYTHFEIKTPELYHLISDVEERYNVAADHPEMVDSIQKIAADYRKRLGDSLKELKGSENRPAGQNSRKHP